MPSRNFGTSPNLNIGPGGRAKEDTLMDKHTAKAFAARVVSELRTGLKIARAEHLGRLAHTDMAMGRLQKALDAWQAVLVIDPNYFDGLLASAWILDLMGKKEEARGFFEKALAVEPENKFLRKNYAQNLATTGNLKEAIGIYERLKQDFPDDYEVLQDLGIAYGYAGDINSAIDALKAAIEIHPTPVAYYNLTVALKKVGNIKDAVYYLKLYLGNPDGEDEAKIRGAQQELLVLEKLLQ